MLNIEECRELIPGHEEYTDEQILSIRDDLHILAELALENYLKDLKMVRTPEGGHNKKIKRVTGGPSP